MTVVGVGRQSQWLILLSLSILLAASVVQGITVSFFNFFEEPVYAFRMDGEMEVGVGKIQPYDHMSLSSIPGDVYSFQTVHVKFVMPPIVKERKIYTVGYPSIQVQCSTTSGDIRAVIKPQWSPHGAARFLDLVKNQYFDGCALNRVVKNFLTQFGIGADYEMRTEFREATIPDDAPPEAGNIPFQPGYLSYAGSGPNSRSTEVFIVMPDTPDHQLAAFGTNPWETPFGYVEPEDVTSVVGEWYSYGDMPPWGKGPDPQLIYNPDGYDYLKNDFPEMSYINECRILTSKDAFEGGVAAAEL